jgi:hypothetical protein
MASVSKPVQSLGTSECLHGEVEAAYEESDIEGEGGRVGEPSGSRGRD